MAQNKFIRFITKLPFVNSFINWAKQRTFPGFYGVPIYDVARFIVKESTKDDITTRANSMAFSFFISLFPGIIFLFTLLPYLPITADYAQMLQNSLEGVLPHEAELFLFQTITDLTSIPREGLLSVGFVLTLFFASNGMYSLMKGFDKSHHEAFKVRSFLERRWMALLLTILGFVLLIVSLVAVILGKVLLGYLFDFISLNSLGRFGLNTIRWLIVVITTYSMVSLIYRYGAATLKRFHFFSPGASIATLLMILTSIAFSYFVNNFGTYNQLYGSIGALIIILVWLQFNSFIILVGFEMNASIAVRGTNFIAGEPKTSTKV